MLSLVEDGNYIDPEAVGREFRHLIARLRGFLTQSFDADGQLIVADPNLAVFEVGDYKPTARTSAQLQSGWLICDGSAVSRTKYQALFSVIGTTYGVGDGSTTFNLPNMQQRFLLGKAASGTGNTLGATGGAIDHTHGMGSHTHSISSDGSHSHGGSTSSDGDHAHSLESLKSAATGTAGSNTLEYEPGASTINYAAGGHGHFTVNPGGSTPDTNNAGSHSHTIASSGSHDHGGNTGSASAGTSDAANPPYIVVNYVIFTGVAN